MVYESSKTATLVRVALITAVLCVLGPIALPVPGSPVPISLIHIGIYLGIYTLGAKLATVSVLVYLLVGSIGLPVFSNYGAGFAKIVGPTGGYLLGFIFMTWIIGRFVDKEKGIAATAPGYVLGNAVCYLFGSLWLSYQAGMPLAAAFMAGVIPYLPFDIIKAGLALWIGPRVRRATRGRAGR